MSALSLIALLVLLWNLGRGPIRINFLRPYIIQALTNETSSYDLAVESVNLELVHSVQPVKIIARNVSFKAKNGDYLVEAPRLSLSFSARALLKGMLAPSSVRVEDPKMFIQNVYGLKENEGQTVEDKRSVNLKKLEFLFGQFEGFLERFNSSERLYMESFINSIEIDNGTLQVNEVETGHQFTLANLNFLFERGLADFVIRTDSAVQFENRTSALDMEVKYRLLNDELLYTLSFSDLVVTDLYDILVPDRENIRGIDIPVNGQLSAIIDFGSMLKHKEQFADTISNNIKDISFVIDGGKGKIGFGDSSDFDYEVSSFNLSGRSSLIFFR